MYSNPTTLLNLTLLPTPVELGVGIDVIGENIEAGTFLIDFF